MVKNIKAGDLVKVADCKGELSVVRRFVGMDSRGRFVCEDQDGKISSWVDAWEIDKKHGYAPYTKETFPKGVSWVRKTGSDTEELVLAASSSYISVDRDDISYDQLLTDYEISSHRMDDWRVAGVKS